MLVPLINIGTVLLWGVTKEIHCLCVCMNTYSCSYAHATSPQKNPIPPCIKRTLLMLQNQTQKLENARIKAACATLI